MKAPELSVIIATWNRPRALARCLAGWAEQMASGIEIVVVDDGSEPAAVVQQPCRLVRVRHGGVGAARNAGLRAARGEYLVLYDDDLDPHPRLAEYCLAFHRQHPAAGAALLLGFGLEQSLQTDPLTRWAFAAHYPFPAAAGWYPAQYFWGGSISCKRALLSHTEFDVGYPFGEDTELALRLNPSPRIYYDGRCRSKATMPITMEAMCGRAEAQGAAACRLGWPLPTANAPVAAPEPVLRALAATPGPAQQGAWEALRCLCIARGWRQWME